MSRELPEDYDLDEFIDQDEFEYPEHADDEMFGMHVIREKGEDPDVSEMTDEEIEALLDMPVVCDNDDEDDDRGDWPEDYEWDDWDDDNIHEFYDNEPIDS